MPPKKFDEDRPWKLMTLEEPGKYLLFDADRGLLADVSAKCNVRALVESIKDRDEDIVRAALEDFGKELMQLTIELADTKYLDRTGEMIEKVAQQTGISFPHRFQRYVELSIIASRPADMWNIARATTKELVLQVHGCTVRQSIKDEGVVYKEFPCQAMCLASFEVARQKTADPLKMRMSKTPAEDGMCEFSFTL